MLKRRAAAGQHKFSLRPAVPPTMLAASAAGSAPLTSLRRRRHLPSQRPFTNLLARRRMLRIGMFQQAPVNGVAGPPSRSARARSSSTFRCPHPYLRSKALARVLRYPILVHRSSLTSGPRAYQQNRRVQLLLRIQQQLLPPPDHQSGLTTVQGRGRSADRLLLSAQVQRGDRRIMCDAPTLPEHQRQPRPPLLHQLKRGAGQAASWERFESAGAREKVSLRGKLLSCCLPLVALVGGIGWEHQVVVRVALSFCMFYSIGLARLPMLWQTYRWYRCDQYPG